MKWVRAVTRQLRKLRCSQNYYNLLQEQKSIDRLDLTAIFLNKLKTSDNYDSIVRVKIPDPMTESRLYETITKHIMHGPDLIPIPFTNVEWTLYKYERYQARQSL
ncbi:1229_t:CDS:2, partial [Diversispora eburnea]